VTTIDIRLQHEIGWLSERLTLTLFPKERYYDSLSGRGSRTQPLNWEEDTVRLSYRCALVRYLPHMVQKLWTLFMQNQARATVNSNCSHLPHTYVWATNTPMLAKAVVFEKRGSLRSEHELMSEYLF